MKEGERGEQRGAETTVHGGGRQWWVGPFILRARFDTRGAEKGARRRVNGQARSRNGHRMVAVAYRGQCADRAWVQSTSRARTTCTPA